MRSQREASSFGLRWQSEAPTPLWLDGIRDFALESRHKANPAKAVSPLRSAPAVQMKTLIEAGLRNTRENPMMHENMEGPLMSRRMALFSLLTGIAFFGWTETPFDYFDNSWSVIGLKDYARGTRITPDNALMIGTTIGTAENEADKASVRIEYGYLHGNTAPQKAPIKRLMDGWMPIVLFTAQDGLVNYEFTVWATPLTSVNDWKSAFDGPSEGENFLTWIMVRVVNTDVAANTSYLCFTQSGPYEEHNHPVPSLSVSDPRYAPRYSKVLDPGKSIEYCMAIPWEPVEPPHYSLKEAKVWLDRTITYWRDLMAKTATLHVPCEKATQAYLASHVCQLIASDNGELHGGEGFYDEFYIRDGAYQMMEMEEAGLWDTARSTMKSYLGHQRDDGRFESQQGQFDANGQAVWTLWQYWKITDDRAFLEQVYPQMRKAVDWTMMTRRETPADAPFTGLLPAAVADGESLWDGKHHIAGYDFWNLRGMLCTADAARALGKTDDADLLQRESSDYRAAIDAAWQRTGLAYFPPSWEKEGTHWGNTETLWPTPIFPNDDPRVAALVREARENYLGGFVEGTIRWSDGKMEPAIHPYMSAYTTLTSLALGENEPVAEEFFWYLLHSTATHAFPEGIFYKRHFAWSNTIPHATGASNYAILLRHILLHEQGEDLHLLAGIPDTWLDDGAEIVLERAPTHFGPMTLHVQGTPQGVRVTLDPPTRNAPKRITLHLPKTRLLEKPLENVEVVLRNPQSKQLDFPSLVAHYLANK